MNWNTALVALLAAIVGAAVSSGYTESRIRRQLAPTFREMSELAKKLAKDKRLLMEENLQLKVSLSNQAPIAGHQSDQVEPDA